MQDPEALLFPLAVIDHIREGLLLLDRDHRIVTANRVVADLAGIAPQAGWDHRQLIEAIGPGAAALENLDTDTRVVIVVAGRLIEVESLDLDADHLLWRWRDCSEELRLHSQVAEQGHVLASTNEAYMVVDARGLVRYVNQFCEEERGYPPGGMVGLQLAAIEHLRHDEGLVPAACDQADTVTRLLEVRRRGGVHRYDAWHLRRDGSRFPVSVSIRPYRLQEETVLLLTASDESERLEFIHQLMDARERAEEANRAKSAFLAVTSHELRTPLTAIIGFCELLLLDWGEGHGDLSSHLGLIHRSATGLLRLINDIIDFAKIEGRSLRFAEETLDPVVLLDDTVARWALRARERGLTLQRMPGNCGAFHGDAGRINQLLDNLVGNACKFTEQGGITLSADADAEETVVFRVSDTGTGISEAAHERVFEPFFQEEEATTRNGQGTGLGLFICRTLARLLGGDVDLEKTGPSGSTFALHLPRAGRPDGSAP